ncbi:MAG: hypothetical protein ABIG11_03345 [bacterium]
MRFLFAIFIFFSFCRSGTAGADYARELNDKLTAEFSAELKKTETGRQTAARFGGKQGEKYGLPPFFLQAGKSAQLAWFDPSARSIYFNTRHINSFFGVRGYSSERTARALLTAEKARRDFVKSADALYLHELVHAAQADAYPDYSLDNPPGRAVEFEYEAYLTENLYFHEKMRKNPGLLKKFLKEGYPDAYMEHALNSYRALSLDMEEYKETIRKLYKADESDYYTLEKAMEIQTGRVEEGKILAYASGDVGGYARKIAGLDALETQKAAYDAYLSGFYRERWPAFSADALIFMGTAALDAGSYPLALQCLAVADEAGQKSGLGQDRMEELRRKGALAILQAAAFIRDRHKKMKLYALSEHLKALDRACEKTGRPFPDDLKQLRDKTYPKAAGFYAKMAGKQKNPVSEDYYKKGAEFFKKKLSEQNETGR